MPLDAILSAFVVFKFLQLDNTNMVAVQTSEIGVTPAPLNVRP
jgi:hypothetical protein